MLIKKNRVTDDITKIEGNRYEMYLIRKVRKTPNVFPGIDNFPVWLRKGTPLKELGINEKELWKSKYLYDSAYHPETGQKMTLIGRMSAQVPMNMMITGCMMTFYQSTPMVIFLQWCNQSFNAIVNYTNRGGNSPIPIQTLVASYLGATSGAIFTALTLNKLVKRGPPLVGKLVPLLAVTAGNCVNIPLMRLTELKEGLELYNDKGEKQGKSKKAARQAITFVAISRILMASPSMILTPILMSLLERHSIIPRKPWAVGSIQVAMCGICLTFATPLCCALFTQYIAVSIDELEENVRNELLIKNPSIKMVYYNKGL